jgi:hypothetical protein
MSFLKMHSSYAKTTTYASYLQEAPVGQLPENHDIAEYSACP